MRRLGKLFFLAVLLVGLPAPASAQTTAGPTLFQHAERAWAVGTLRLGKPLQFRDGRILVFPSQFADLAWAPPGGKPRNLMLVHEQFSDDNGQPFLKYGDEIFAPFELLPQNSYWRDNLPNTRRHAVAGGRRYVFRGAEIPEVRKVLVAYLAAHDTKGMERWKGELIAVAGALGSPVQVLREDAAEFLATYPTLARDFAPEIVAPVLAFLRGDAPVELKTNVVEAFTKSGIADIEPGLRELASRDDATGAVALAGLDRLGKPVPPERLPVLAKASNEAVRAYAAGALGRRGAEDAQALATATALLESAEQPTAVREAAAQGIAAGGTAAGVQTLAKAIERADGASRAAAAGLAASSRPESADLLVGILTEKDGQAAQAAVAGLSRKPGCSLCRKVLEEQHEKHRDPEVRRLIGLVLEVPVEHKH